ncbi:MAG: uroporphyrinogen-III C-methyltransferase [Desulfovibrionaceae bacterium]|nr:uroporphyrinogen-III C-methyltransferase [Desulfovibrionaceae bacterium]
MKVYLLGAGPGDPGLLTLKARDILETADVIVYDALASTELLSLAKPSAEIIYVGKIADQHALPQQEINALLVKKAREKGVVARLKGGDPYIFGRGAEEALVLKEANIPFEEVPGISSTIAAPAYAGIPLTYREHCSAVTLITGHEDPNKNSSAINWQALATSRATLVFVMGMKNLEHICTNLMQAGLDKTTPAAIIYRGTTAKQRTLIATLATLAKEAACQNFSNPSVIVIGQVVQLAPTLNWFEQQALFGKSIVVTRAREQASDLVRLLQDKGAEVIQCPTIAIKPLQSQENLHTCLQNIAAYNWLIFTSSNSVKIFFAEMAKLHFDARNLHGLKICAIGPGTQNALQNYGLYTDLLPERFVAESVIEAFVKHVGQDLSACKILLPRASVARDVLPERLTKLGATVQVVPIYTTEACATGQAEITERLKNGNINCISFTSTSTVHNFFKLVDPALLHEHPEVQLAAIGPITAKTLATYGLNCHIQPANYTIPDLAQAIITHLTSI